VSCLDRWPHTRASGGRRESSEVRAREQTFLLSILLSWRAKGPVVAKDDDAFILHEMRTSKGLNPEQELQTKLGKNKRLIIIIRVRMRKKEIQTRRRILVKLLNFHGMLSHS
jgi:hypothetical protein